MQEDDLKRGGKNQKTTDITFTKERLSGKRTYQRKKGFTIGGDEETDGCCAEK